MLSGALRCSVCGGSHIIKSQCHYGCPTNMGAHRARHAREAEAAVAQAVAAIDASDPKPVDATALPQLIGRYLATCNGSSAKTPRALTILSKLLGEITLQSNAKGLVAVLRGNVSGIL